MGEKRADGSKLHDIASRRRKAAKLLAIIRSALGDDLTRMRALDVGCASGLITQTLAPHLGGIIGLEYESTAVAMMDASVAPNLLFLQGDATCLPLAAETVDLVICAQVYEHVADAEAMVAEIWRVLRPGGICAFSGPNRLDVIERHYGLPFVSWFPHRWADAYLRLAGRAPTYAEHPRTYWGLRQLWRDFDWADYTVSMFREPDRFACREDLGSLAWIGRWPVWLLRAMMPLYPNYNWVLTKRAEGA